MFQTLIVSSDEQVRNDPTGKHGCNSSLMNGYVYVQKSKLRKFPYKRPRSLFVYDIFGCGIIRGGLMKLFEKWHEKN